jgi:hypothetical protein
VGLSVLLAASLAQPQSLLSVCTSPDACPYQRCYILFDKTCICPLKLLASCCVYLAPFQNSCLIINYAVMQSEAWSDSTSTLLPGPPSVRPLLLTELHERYRSFNPASRRSLSETGDTQPLQDPDEEFQPCKQAVPHFDPAFFSGYPAVVGVSILQAGGPSFRQ